AIYDFADAKGADDAVARAWKAHKGEAPYAQTNRVTGADTDGWSKLTRYDYDVPPNLRRAVRVSARFANGAWTVVLLDAERAVAEKRGSQLALVVGKLLPKGTARESLAGKKAHELDAARIAALTKFVEDAEQVTGVPGVAFGLIQHGKV